MKELVLCIISDTHGEHSALNLTNEIIKKNNVDILVHCGDFTNWGNPDHLFSFNQWLGKLDLSKERKLVICGNHDSKVTFELKHKYKVDFEKDLGNATLLCKEYGATVMVDGLVLSGIPYNNPKVPDSQFWLKQFPKETNVLITHNALPKTTLCSKNMGSASLKEAVKQHFQERNNSGSSDFLHCFGHVHDRHGHETLLAEKARELIILNAANVNKHRKIAYDPIFVKCRLVESNQWKFELS